MPPQDDDDRREKRERRMQAARDLAILHPMVNSTLVSWGAETISAGDARKRAFTTLVDLHTECRDILAERDD